MFAEAHGADRVLWAVVLPETGSRYLATQPKSVGCNKLLTKPLRKFNSCMVSLYRRRQTGPRRPHPRAHQCSMPTAAESTGSCPLAWRSLRRTVVRMPKWDPRRR